MSTSLQDLIGAAQKLSPLERLDLIRALSQSLQRTYVEGDADFWHPKTLEQHVEAQDAPVITDISQLKAELRLSLALRASAVPGEASTPGGRPV